MLVGRVKRVLHCAASINFTDKNETQLTNVAGLLHVLELTDVLDAWHVIHVSTAYVVGDAPYPSIFAGDARGKTIASFSKTPFASRS